MDQAAVKNLIINGDRPFRRMLLSSDIAISYEIDVKSVQEADAASSSIGSPNEDMFCLELCEVIT